MAFLGALVFGRGFGRSLWLGSHSRSSLRLRQRLACRVHDRIRRQPEVLVDLLVGSRGAEVVDADDQPAVPDPALPALRYPGLDRHPCPDLRREDLLR